MVSFAADNLRVQFQRVQKSEFGLLRSRVFEDWRCQWLHERDPATLAPQEPASISVAAYRYQRLLVISYLHNVNECKVSIAFMNGAIFGAEITNSWFNAPNGIIPMPNPNDEIIGSHVVCLTGYNDHKGMFKFINSWGSSWGDKGYGYFPYEFFEKYLIECWINLPFNVDLFKTQIVLNYKGKVIYYRLIPSALYSHVHVLEVSDNITNDYKGWASGVEYEGFLNVEELFILPVCRHQGLSKAHKISPAPVRWADYLMANEVPKDRYEEACIFNSRHGFAEEQSDSIHKYL